jgi:phage repressor protein C with HTH and peptisase S24 domain
MSFGESDEAALYVPAVSESVDIGKRIKQVRAARNGLSQAEFASKLGKTTRGAVGNWERGLGIKRENMQAIADKFDVSFEWLASGRGAMDAEPPDRRSSHHQPNAIIGDKLIDRGEYIPLYGHAVGGVDGEFVLNGNKLDDILAPPGLSPVRGAYAVTVAGESMEPRYYDGETVFVDPMMRVRRGDFVVAQIRNPAADENDHDAAPLAYIKRFVRHNETELVLEQFNPPKELRFPHADVRSVHFIVLGGRAV